jgi:intracellular septation protein
MKFLYDLFPIILFFIAYKIHGIYVATAVAIAASFLQVSLYWFKHHKIEKMHLATLVLITVFGGITLALQDPIFIKWKSTVINWLFGIVFLGSQFIGKKTIVERMLGSNISLPSFVWPKLNMAWVVFFITLGFINLYVMFNYDTETWMNFKLFGMMGLTMLFLLAQGIYLAQHIQEEAIEVKKEDDE